MLCGLYHFGKAIVSKNSSTLTIRIIRIKLIRLFIIFQVIAIFGMQWLHVSRVRNAGRVLCEVGCI
jgi:hypothetical protein